MGTTQKKGSRKWRPLPFKVYRNIASNLSGNMLRPKLLLLDLDGTVYRGEVPVPGAAEAIRDARAAGLRILFVTNRANRSPGVVARQLRSLRIECRKADVITSAAATASYCAAHGGRRCHIVGERGVREAFAAQGLLSVDDGPADWVVVSLDRRFTYSKLAKASAFILGGARFVITNSDQRITIGDDILPEAGAIAASIQAVTGVEPVVIGKPSPTLFLEALRMAGCAPAEALAVGDYLGTDIAAAKAAGIPSCLMLTGVSTRADVERSTLRPDIVCEGWRDFRNALHLLTQV